MMASQKDVISFRWDSQKRICNVVTHESSIVSDPDPGVSCYLFELVSWFLQKWRGHSFKMSLLHLLGDKVLSSSHY